MLVATRRTRSARHLRLAVLAAALIAIDARAQLIAIAWDNADRFETVVNVAPGKFAEACGQLAQGQSIVWSFKGDKPMKFNIHHHEGKQVVFAAKQDAAVDARGKLDISVSQDYCWMWTNAMDTPVRLEFVLQKR